MIFSSDIQIGFNARLFPGFWRPALEEVAFAASEGFSAIQFPGLKNGLDAEKLGCTLEEMADALKVSGIMAVMEIVVRVNKNGLSSEGKTPLEVLEANLPAITTLPCKCVHWHLVPEFSSSDFSDFEQSFTHQFQEAVELGKRHGFVFGFEHNEPTLGLFGTSKACKAMLDNVDGLGFVWDLNHVIPDHRAGFIELAPRMRMLHISDTPLPVVNHHLPIGSGTINFSQYLGELKNRGFKGIGILEIGGLPQSGGYGRDSDEALIESKKAIGKLIR